MTKMGDLGKENGVGVPFAPGLPAPPSIEMKTVELTHGPNGYKLNPPITVELPAKMNPATKDVYDYIIESLLACTPRLIPFACTSQTIFELAKYLRRHQSSSSYTLRNYVWGTWRFCGWIKKKPDEVIQECKDVEGLPDQKKLFELANQLDEFNGFLRAQKLASSTVSSYIKAVKSLCQANRLKLELPYKIKRVAKYEDRAPTPEELSKMVDIADIRDEVILSCLALGGFREGTLAQLKYMHVKEDLERGVVPIHVHVEAEITKGKYRAYDTFLGKEATDFLRMYIDMRKRGSLRKEMPTDQWREFVRRIKNGEKARELRRELNIDNIRGIPPEDINDESPLVRDEHSAVPKPITPKQIYNTVHQLYKKAGLIPDNLGHQRRYKLRVHSIRKFFRTQLAALGVDRDYIEYMMGHTISTYHDIQMKGIEFLRNIYIGSGLSIKPKTKASRLEILKQMVSAWGMDPDKVLVRGAFAEPHRVFVSPQDREDSQMEMLCKALVEKMRKELKEKNP